MWVCAYDVKLVTYSALKIADWHNNEEKSMRTKKKLKVQVKSACTFYQNWTQPKLSTAPTNWNQSFQNDKKKTNPKPN